MGEKTGVEISEAAGVLAGPASAERYNKVWQMGDTIQSGIGQSDNLFTPLQLANYCATVANKGTRYEMHFVKAVINTSSGSIEETGATVAEELPISDDTFNIVQEGMRMVAEQNTFSSIFKNSGVDVAAKQVHHRLSETEKKQTTAFLSPLRHMTSPKFQ